MLSFIYLHENLFCLEAHESDNSYILKKPIIYEMKLRNSLLLLSNNYIKEDFLVYNMILSFIIVILIYDLTLSNICMLQVQRWAEDMSILITTYEGTHNHPLPISATAMASATSAAASVLQCRSSTSQLGSSVSASTTPNLHGLNFTFSENASPHDQLYFPNSSISNPNSHPTIVLDLTAPATFSHFNRLSSSAPRYNSSSTCLNFSSQSSTNSPQTYWTSGYSNNYANYLGKQPAQEHIYQPYMQMMNNPSTPLPTPQVQSFTESTIAATTEVITSNPNFQSALAAAISSYIGQKNVGGPGESSGLDMKWVKPNFSITSADDLSARNGTVGFASSLLNKYLPSSTHQQPAASIFPLNSLPFSASKTASGSPVEVKDHVKI